MLSNFAHRYNQSTDWGENLLNTVAGKAIRHLFTRTESVEVKVRCHPSTKLLQGSVDINQAFQEIQFEPETIPETQREISQRLTLILGEVFNNMVDLDRFDLDGVTMRLNRLETQGKMLWLSGSAQIERFPRSR